MYYAQLRAFHAVAMHGGFSKAARKLNLTQPAVSDQVRKLEELFDVQLFDRSRRAVRPTALGRRLFEITRRMFEMEQEAIELLSESHALRTGTLQLAADAPLHLVELIADFRARYPGVAVTLSVGNSDEVLTRLFEFAADVAVLADVADDPRLHCMVLRRDPLVACVARGHPLATRPAIKMADLAREPLVMREPGSITRALVDGEFRRHGLSYTVGLEADGREAMREAVAAGIGIGIVSAPEFGHDERLRAIAIADCRALMTETLVCLKERARLRTVTAFLAIAARRAAAAEAARVAP